VSEHVRCNVHNLYVCVVADLPKSSSSSSSSSSSLPTNERTNEVERTNERTKCCFWCGKGLFAVAFAFATAVASLHRRRRRRRCRGAAPDSCLLPLLLFVVEKRPLTACVRKANRRRRGMEASRDREMQVTVTLAWRREWSTCLKPVNCCSSCERAFGRL